MDMIAHFTFQNFKKKKYYAGPRELGERAESTGHNVFN